jgi:hypothetical protein
MNEKYKFIREIVLGFLIAYITYFSIEESLLLIIAAILIALILWLWKKVNTLSFLGAAMAGIAPNLLEKGRVTELRILLILIAVICLVELGLIFFSDKKDLRIVHTT